MKNACRKIITLLAAGVLLAACTAKPDDSGAPAYTHISQEEAAKMMQANDNHIIVDVRTNEEYVQGHIPGAVCIPNETIEDEMPAELPDKAQVILLYCRSGVRAKNAAEKLAGMGYEHVYEFGGINDWKGEIVNDIVYETEDRCQLQFMINGTPLYAIPADNSSAEALIEKLGGKTLELSMSDYGGFEKVGSLPWDLPRNDEQMTTKPGDITLYQGNQLSIYYDENSWSLTPIAKLTGVTAGEIREILGDGDITVEILVDWLDY